MADRRLLLSGDGLLLLTGDDWLLVHQSVPLPVTDRRVTCGLSAPQVVTVTGANFPANARVLVTAPGASPVLVLPIAASSTSVTFSFIFAVCGGYLIQIADATGACDPDVSTAVTLNPVPAPLELQDAPLTLGELCDQTLQRLSDDSGVIWSRDEVRTYLRRAYDLVATNYAVFWDMVYSENLPRAWSVSQPWELGFLTNWATGFNAGVANFTAEFERTAGESIGFDERNRIGPANHTSPFEATDGLLTRAGASAAISATDDLPATLTMLDRALWDTRVIEALEARSYSRMDARYEITAGEVYGYIWQKDGVRTFRKVRVPAEACDTVTVNGSWGILRSPTNLPPGGTVTGTWGIPRRLPGYHPMGAEVWGLPRRPYQDAKNVRIEHFRLGRSLVDDTDVCELPARYARYLRDYAASECLGRPGPGYDTILAQHYDMRWKRGLTRIARRIVQVDTEFVHVLGGSGQPTTRRPPRPALPWAYGSRVR